jgi:hypothetical protein
MSYRLNAFVTFALVVWLGTAACDDGTGPGAGSIALSVVVPSDNGGAAATSPAMFDLVYVDGQSTLTLNSVELVLSEIEIELVDDDSCDDGASSEDACEEFEAGPRVFDLPMDGTTEPLLIVDDVPAGLYDELEIEVHKVSAEDESLITQRPDLADASVKVTGDLDGTAFVFTSGVEEEFEFELSPPVDSSTGSINVTLSIDVESWFRADNGSLLDPSLEANRSEIETNIEQSFEAFEDDDGDGEDDAESAS